MALGEREARPLRGCESTLFFYPNRIEKESPEKLLWHVTERGARAYFGTKYNMLHQKRDWERRATFRLTEKIYRKEKMHG